MTTGFHYWKLVVNLVVSETIPMQTEISQLLSDTVIALFQANGKLLEWGDAFTAPYGLTSARWQILGAIALASHQLTAPQIAEQMGVSRQGAQKQLNLLLEDGLLEKLPNPSHLRSPLYRLSTQGSALFERVNQAWQVHAAKSGAAFTEQALATTLHTLRLIAQLHEIPPQGEHDET
ncbi:MarR family winged helix-turn-helix transcriptional regulator [Aquitalea sp. ASV15]|uniref:MarR family winged helix-turn-helix transcriptional regulator n=1 Tax=Aquitalea sp. ASV15 TaxID=2795104 RepID=UPI0018ED88D3|nr:MarR family winged helix-turn-helix transcriptional regulator [Aquitalea sp. ASV15]